MKVERFVLGPFGTNTYVVSDDDGKVLLIDPACSNEYERQQLYRYISNIKSQISNFKLSIVATHGHLDHLWGAKWATETWGVPVLMHEADIPMAKAMQQQYDLFGIRATAEPFPMENIKSEILNLKSQMSNFKLLETPGHTPGSICLYFNDPLQIPNHKSPILVSGDTLFRMGYGRTDLPGGDMGQLIDSLERLFALPADTLVYPGHGDFTTIGAERR
ncbi:MAG: MBL fold metallo-hydrolase [Paludibacteraceae bacterium]|nr:MBL fold metallo-hydrolase [Paludibacteraceae bacterium]